MYAATAARRETATLGMWVFLATELMFFGPLFFGYLHGRILQPQAFAEASHHTHLWLGTINTAILLTSSLFMAFAVQKKSRSFLALTGLLGFAFLCIKGVEYHSEMSEPASLFLYLYFAMTGLHAIHLTIGIGLVAWAARRLQVVEYVGLYWHFVDVIWIFLYPMFYLLERWH